MFAPTKSVPAGETQLPLPDDRRSRHDQRVEPAEIVKLAEPPGVVVTVRFCDHAIGSLVGKVPAARLRRSVPLTVVESIGPVGFPTFACTPLSTFWCPTSIGNEST